MKIDVDNFVQKLAIICFTIIVVSSIIGLSVYQINDRVLMAKNIEDGINKGIDPMSVRCSYVHGDDSICIAFATKRSDLMLQLQSVTPKK